jgi:hypothetical protein
MNAIKYPKSIMSNQKSFQMQINNKHLKEKFITINTINKLTVLFLFDDFYSLKRISSSRLIKASTKVRRYMVICRFLVHIKLF